MWVKFSGVWVIANNVARLKNLKVHIKWKDRQSFTRIRKLEEGNKVKTRQWIITTRVCKTRLGIQAGPPVLLCPSLLFFLQVINTCAKQLFEVSQKETSLQDSPQHFSFPVTSPSVSPLNPHCSSAGQEVFGSAGLVEVTLGLWWPDRLWLTSLL